MKKIYIETQDSFNPVYTLLKGLSETLPGVRHEKATALYIDDSLVADAVERLLDAAGIQYSAANGGSLMADAIYYLEGVPYTLKELHPQQPAPEIEAPAASEPVEAAALEPEADRPVCEECLLEFDPERKGQRFCKREDCRSARKLRYAREAHNRKQKPQDNQPTDAELEDAAALEGEIDRELAAIAAQVEEGILAGGQEADAGDTQPDETREAPVQRKSKAQLWIVEDGPRAGEQLTTSQLETELMLGQMQPGQHLRHRRIGRRRVIRTGGVAQKLGIVAGN